MLICSLCGHKGFQENSILWPDLIKEWQLSADEAAYVDRQQGMRCEGCGANLRGVALGYAIRSALSVSLPLNEFAQTDAAKALRILDMNGTSVSSVFAWLPHYLRADYPKVDMQAMPYDDEEFDLVVHSDTLEHIPNPIYALVECRRVLKSSGRLCYTVPIIIGRMTRSREGLPPSYHGKATDRREDYLVQTEFGADAWIYPMRAGFASVRLNTLLFPAALAITAER